MQREGIDFVEIFAPIAKFQEIYIQFPQGLELPEEFKKGAPALRLLKGLYGLKQAPRIWNDLVNCNAASSQLYSL